ncbi:GtrA family protein [Bradyrhizobium sp. RT3b]|uniref:GtrA family protein n=1 Tax=Bradyrhizobium sp. RT3b TaxID=3156334 RepID=UPI00339ABD10
MSGLVALIPTSVGLALRFGLTGVTTTLLYFVITNAFVLFFAVQPIVSSIGSYVISVVISYFMQSRFTFGLCDDSFDQVARFVLMSLAGLVVSWCVMALTVSLLQWPYLIGAVGVCVTIPVLNFFLMRGWVFGVCGGSTVAMGESK